MRESEIKHLQSDTVTSIWPIDDWQIWFQNKKKTNIVVFSWIIKDIAKNPNFVLFLSALRRAVAVG